MREDCTKTKTKEELVESPKKLVGGLKVEKPNNAQRIEVRHDRIPELPKQARDRLEEIIGNGIVSPELVQQEDLPVLGIEYEGDQELGSLALISTLGIDNNQYVREQTNALMNATASRKDGAKYMGEQMTASFALIASIAPLDAIESMLASHMVCYTLSNNESAEQSNPHQDNKTIGQCHKPAN
ncbi:hypothetical protein J0X12_03240 [Sneathiella sp. CAU 1612]|uniref:Uncharacterized protein n=1 Tax=Sneathiella sedimenti TaxID=2816034 RepID=A0ABS3F2L6_9PROT|nr:hypothetical protein [Sneathiella sedimenti]MBO0332612.1 hypothetical protein [Sneathiella sedimenti]